jgi:DNA repair exonuclease SbcCD ATPase subunit
VVTGLFALLQQTVPEVAPTIPTSSDGTLQMQIAIMVTMVLGFLYNIYMQRAKAAEDRRKDDLRMAEEERRRKWDIEDRMHAREEAIKRMQLVHNKIDEVKNEAQTAVIHAETAVRKVDERSDQLATKLEENTEISRQAFKEGNNFNMKLSEVLRRFDNSEASLEVSKTTIRAVSPGDESEHARPSETPPPDS